MGVTEMCDVKIQDLLCLFRLGLSKHNDHISNLGQWDVKLQNVWDLAMGRWAQPSQPIHMDVHVFAYK